MTASGGADLGSDGERIGPILVLHVDGDEAVLSDTAAYVATNYPDIRVESYSDPDAALDRLDTIWIDCLVSEYVLSESTGLELIAAARNRQPGLPLVLYTDTRPETVAADAMNAGVTGYIQKTVDPGDYDRLVDRIQTAIGPVRSQRRVDRLTAVALAVRAANSYFPDATSSAVLLDGVTAALTSTGPYVGAVAGRFDTDTGFRPEAWSGSDACPLESGDDATIPSSLLQAVRRTGESQYRQDVGPDPVDVVGPLLPGEDYRSLLALPVTAGSALSGALVVYDSGPFAFGPAERALLEAVAGDLAVALSTIDRRKRSLDLECYETVFETATDGLFLVGALEGEIRVEHVNSAQKRMWGVEDRTLEGQSLAAGLDGEQADLIRDHLRLCIDREAPVSYEFATAGRTTRTNLSPVHSAGAVTHAVGVTRDITALTRTQTELELLNRVLRHDIRTDMQVVLGWAALLADSTDGEATEYVEKIVTTGKHIVELTDIARDFVETVVANGDAVLEPLAVSPVLEAEVEKAREAYGDAEFHLSDRTGDPTVLANEMLASVFRNVLTNAVQHNDAPVPRIEVDLTDGDGRVVVRVVDNGSGVPEERRQAVFGKGERGLGSPGTGIGLYLVDKLVGLYGGSVRIEDADGGGAAVVISFPTI